ncbi:MAG: VacB/RNase II family 3'-5' exoribonuclease [Elusimicrobia bacterium]|nr:VacB/RNase II family 3'-5' exoribonuclease [Elusimicrobiota bacterium]
MVGYGQHQDINKSFMRQHWKKHQEHRGARRHGAIIEGVIQHHGRFAFLLANEPGGSDVFLRGPGINLAMDGDRVSARVRPERDGRFSGEILEVLKHARTSIVGVLKKIPHGWVLFPEKGNAPAAQVLGFLHKIVPQEGSFAVLEVSRWPTEKQGAAGMVTELLGAPGDLRARITMFLRSRGIAETFPKEVLAQSGSLPEKLEPKLWHGREELFNLTIVTIDGADAKDFDDAVSIESLDGGIVRLGVHIADVAHYVKPGSALDKEAYERGTSVYLPDRVVPMLPPTLSNNLCSLVPLEERLTVSVFMDIDSKGNVTKRRLANTVIRSCRRFTYEEVQTFLDGGKVSAVPKAAEQAVMLMGDMSDVLYRARVKRGALDFDLPEYKVETDANGKPLGVSLRPRLKSHRLIEEFMLLANEAIATELIAAKAPFLHRRHDEPDPVKINTLAKTLGELGLSAGHLTSGNTHKALQDILRQTLDHPLSAIINSLMVRSMKQAVYSPESSGHFGIAAEAYAHFTSPIRRYPDLLAHRAIKALIAGQKENFDDHFLVKAGEHCSERERTAAEAEYKAVDLMRAELFKDKIGSVMEGTVTTVIDRGSFVMCGDTGAEGMLRVTNLKPGIKVKVIVNAVDTVEGKIDLLLAEKPKMPAQWRFSHSKPAKRHRK